MMKKQFPILLISIIFLVSCNSTIAIPIETAAPVPEPTRAAPPEQLNNPTPTLVPTRPAWRWSNALVALNDMAVLPDAEMWAIGQNGTILHDRVRIAHLSEELAYQGERGGGYMSAIDFPSEDSGWITAWGGQILHWDGEAWTTSMPFDPEKYIGWFDIDFANEDTGWVAGCDVDSTLQTPVLNRWNGSSWENVPLPDADQGNYCLVDITVISATDAWVVGNENGVLFHWDGSTWQQFPTPPMDNAIAIGAVSTGQVWVLDGNVIYYWDTSEWTQTDMPVYFWYSENDSARPKILAIAQDDVWVGGNALYHWDGTEWKNENYNREFGYIVDLEADPDGNVWALTLSGTLLELNAE